MILGWNMTHIPARFLPEDEMHYCTCVNITICFSPQWGSVKKRLSACVEHAIQKDMNYNSNKLMRKCIFYGTSSNHSFLRNECYTDEPSCLSRVSSGMFGALIETTISPRLVTHWQTRSTHPERLSKRLKYHSPKTHGFMSLHWLAQSSRVYLSPMRLSSPLHSVL